MLRLKIKKCYFLSTITLCFGSLLSQSQIASAQLRFGRGVQPGLENHFLEYQIQQQPLEKMRSISGCSVGIGVGCNKTASLLQEIVTESTGKTYQDLLLKAAGGQDNYLRFTSYYPQSVNIDTMPLNSFWINGGDYVLDSHQYSGVGDLATIPKSDLRQVVRQFKYAPVASDSNNLNLQQGLIGLKTAYGKTLLEEAQKIPDIEQQIAASGLNSAETNFHLQQFIDSVEAIESGNLQRLNQSLYRLLSNPYTADPGVLNRPPLGISDNLESIIGVGLEGDEYISSVLTGESSQTALFGFPEAIATSTNVATNNNTPLYIAAGVGGLTLLTLLLINSDGDSSSNALAANPTQIENTNSPDNPGGGNLNPRNNSPNGTDDQGSTGEPNINFPNNGNNPDLEILTPPVVIVEEFPPQPPTNEVVKVPETNSVMQFVIVIALALLVGQKTRER